MAESPLETVTENTGYALQTLLISRDEELTRDLVAELGADTVVVTDSLEAGIRKLGYLDCGVGIYDLAADVTDDDVLALKAAKPSLAIIALCEKERVGDLLNSAVSDVIFRVMARPPGQGQLRLALRSAFQEHEQLRKRIADGEALATGIDSKTCLCKAYIHEKSPKCGGSGRAGSTCPLGCAALSTTR